MPLISPLMPVPHPRRRLANANLKNAQQLQMLVNMVDILGEKFSHQ